ncbi:MAG: nitrous oxide reductase family maturation protein NosD [Bacteroidetes bacterium]|nr:MAG: nitrous oxide reductase family maturation protein NosD [Bacteroidota bacterium]MBL1143477.1 nitrous oxide reductase family maturation protein NosD [Bacteroidota bacterium]NOG56280.1 nitrous oxide reductase family maturation protein NosD [Bacteroidota bacterium]
MIRFLVITLTLLFVHLNVQGIEVCKSCKVSSIHEAVKAAKSGDTLWVKKGTYHEYNILIDKPLTLIGIEFPTIDGQDQGEIIRVVSDSVTIDGLFIINVGTSYTTDYAAIRVVRSKNFVIKNVILEKLFFGIFIEKSSLGKIYHNKIIGDAVDEYNSGNGIHLWYSKEIEISKNIVQGVRDGIYLEFSDYISVDENISRDNLRYGLHFMFSNNDVYSKNIFENNGAGVAVMFSKHIRMYENTFRDNWGTASFGLLLKEINDLEVENNVFRNNTIAISVEGANRVNYKGNTFESNGWAIKVKGACYANLYSGNEFLHNSFDVSYNSKINDNVFDQNYWSKYSGYDLDKDGIGDIPFRPVKLFSYIVNRTPETIVLMRSLFIDIIDFSEKVSPVFTPDELQDFNPLMKRLK